MDLEVFKGKVDKKCEEINPVLNSLDKALHGQALREKMVELSSYLSRYNELMDHASLKMGVQEDLVEDVESLAMQSLCAKEDGDNGGKKIATTLKSYFINNHEVLLKDGTTTNLFSEKITLRYYKYAFSRFKSVCKNIELLLGIAQSGLSFDREEMKSSKY